MKKLVTLFSAMIFVLSMVSIVSAYTWTDTVDPVDVLIGNLQSYNYTHDLTDNVDPFTPLQDLITDYSLSIALYDDQDTRGETAYINLPGLISDGFYNFTYTNQEFGWSIAGIAALNLLGEIDVQVKSLGGDFYFASSNLEANGYNVPEPATMLLLGSGLLGLGMFRRKRINS